MSENYLNIKDIAAKYTWWASNFKIRKPKDPQVVTAGDIITGPDVEIINKDLYIATINEDGELYMELET